MRPNPVAFALGLALIASLTGCAVQSGHTQTQNCPSHVVGRYVNGDRTTDFQFLFELEGSCPVCMQGTDPVPTTTSTAAQMDENAPSVEDATTEISLPQAPTSPTLSTEKAALAQNAVIYRGNIWVYVVGAYGRVRNEHVITAADSTKFAIAPIGLGNKFAVMHFDHVHGESVTVTPLNSVPAATLTETSYVDVTFDTQGIVNISAPSKFLEDGSDLPVVHRAALNRIKALRQQWGLP